MPRRWARVSAASRNKLVSAPATELPLPQDKAAVPFKTKNPVFWRVMGEKEGPYETKPREGSYQRATCGLAPLQPIKPSCRINNCDDPPFRRSKKLLVRDDAVSVICNRLAVKTPLENIVPLRVCELLTVYVPVVPVPVPSAVMNVPATTLDPYISLPT